MIIISISLSSANPLLIAHGGGKYWEGQNFSYIEKSIDYGADIIELDIKLKGNDYIVKHSIFSKSQGLLTGALDKIKNASLYLDIKDNNINPNDLIAFIKNKTDNTIIIGSFNKNILKKNK